MQPSKSIKSITYLKAHTSKAIRDIVATRQPMIVTINGNAKVVLQDINSYERTQQTLAMLKLLIRSKEKMKRGGVKSMADAFTSLHKRIASYRNA